MIAGLNIGNKNTYTDFGLLMTHRVIGSSPVKTKTLSVPWSDGRINLTNINGRSYYDNRKLSFDFKLLNRSDFYTTYTELSEYLHGKFLRVSLEEDPLYYYYGMCSISDFDVSKRLGKITVYVDAEPYKYKDIPDQIINVSGTKTLIVSSGGLEVVPVFQVETLTSTSLTVVSSRNNKTYSLGLGRNRFPSLTVAGADNVTLTFSGQSRVIMSYKEARL